jgi:uncharacterized protein YecE (DUF72 family)
MLAHYVQQFNTVEVNNTFYGLPAGKSLAAWRDLTPGDFHFAVKGSRYLTHMKKLKNTGEGVERFLEAVDVLGKKLGPILFQLPPNWERDLDRLAGFLALLPKHYRYVFEFRNETWNAQETYDLLKKYKAGYCIYDLAGYRSPIQVTVDFAYVRLHGPGDKYQGSYTDTALQKWAGTIRSWSKELSGVYVYFDNDIGGCAPRNALRLTQMI